MAQQVVYTGTGRRKDSVARVRLMPDNDQIAINKEDVTKYIPCPSLVQDMKQPLALAKTEGQHNIEVNVNGGGFSRRAGAIRPGIARTLLEVGPGFRGPLKKASMLTRDPRMKERKKPSLKKARKTSQLSEC